MKTGTIMTQAALNKAFDGYWPCLLSDYVTQLPREKKGQMRRYTVLKDLPTKGEYIELKRHRYTTTVEDLVSDAQGEIESLADEMQEWYDGMPEGFQAGDKGERLQEAADTLENIQIEDVPEEFGELTTVYYPSLKAESRADRASEAASMLTEAVAAIREFVEGLEGDAADEVDANFADDLESAAGELEGVEFPGMFD